MRQFWLLNNYDWRFLAEAGLLGFLTALTTVRVYSRALRCQGRERLGWLGLDAAVTGLGVWAANFTSMLAYDPGTAIAYDPFWVAVSLLAAMLLAMPVGAIVLSTNLWRIGILGGLHVGASLAILQIVGLASWNVAGAVVWDPLNMACAVVVSAFLGGLAIAIARPSRRWGERFAGAGVLTSAVAAQHFVSMAGVSVVRDPFYTLDPPGLSQTSLIIAITAATLLLIGAAATLATLDKRAQRLARSRVRELADAALEGLVMCENGVIVDANAGFRNLLDLERNDLRGRQFTDLVSPAQRALVPDRPGEAREMELVSASGALVVAEVVARELGSSGGSRRVLAVRDLRDLRHAQERIHHLAHYDALTGLANRTTFRDRLDRALEAAERTQGSVAVLCLDIERFKEINDVLGHAAGDAVLIEAARRLLAELGEHDVVARLGSDEFAIIPATLSSAQDAMALAQCLMAAMARPITLHEQTTTAGCSVGIALFPDHGTTAGELLANAATALARAKDEEAAACRCYDPEMDSVVRDRRLLAQDLRHALETDRGLEVHYQPQFRARTREVVGFEALSRWQHPKRGYVPPDEFIAIAEEYGLMLDLGEWVLREACTEAARWSEPLQIAVNLSTVQFQDGSLPERVAEILLETGLPASRLELEITETVLIKDSHRALSLLRRIKILGVRIAMDDFGTGYSCLSTLQAFPFDTLKIDRGFVDKVETQPQATAIVHAILSLGRSLSIPVVAEGVETEAQLAFLAGAGNGDLQVQGYLLGRPAPIVSYAAMVGRDEPCEPQRLAATG